MTRIMKKILAITLAAATLSSCGVLKSYDRDDVVGQVKTDGLYGDAQTGSDSLGLGDLRWRDIFTDPQLQSLIDKALAQNTNMRNADLQIKQIKYALSASKTAFIPFITFSPQGTITQISDTYNRGQYDRTSYNYGLALTLGWQNYNPVDLIIQTKSAKSSKQRLENARQAIQVSIVANVAQMYYTLSQLDQTLAIVSETRDNWATYVDMQRQLMDAGQANAAAVASYEATYYNICQSVNSIQDNIRLLENNLSALLGEMPGGISSLHSAEALDRFTLPAKISTGAPISILARRPDVREAEFVLQSAYYKKNRAIASFFPKLTLSGTGSFSNGQAGNVIANPGVILHNFAASLVQPIFAGGALRAQYKSAKIDVEIAINDFVQKVIDAGNEVNSAMVSINTAGKQRELIDKQVDALQRAYDATNLLYQHYGSNYLNVITAHNSLLQGKTTQITNRMDQISATIQLYQALGGGAK